MASALTLGVNPVILHKKFGARITVRTHRNSQGDAADAVFFIHSGTVKHTVVSAHQKKAVIAFLRRGGFLAKAVWQGKLCGFTP